MKTTLNSPFRKSGPGASDRTILARRSFLAGGLGVLAASALVACSDKSSDTSGSSGGDGSAKTQLVVAAGALSPTLDGVVGGGGITLEAFEMNANLQAGLVRNPYIDGATPGTVIQDFNEYVPYLADSYEVSDDGLVYTFKLREDLLSPIGNPFSADDVIWSFERKWNTPTYSSGSWSGGFDGPEKNLKKIDDHTVEFTLSAAGFGLTFLGLLANLQGHIYDSKQLLEHATPDDPYAVTWASANGGWGFGPYYVTSQTPDQEMILTANPNYALGEPAIKQVALRVVPDAGTRATLVANGDVDMAENTRPTDQARLASNDSVVVPEADDPIEYVDLTLVTNKAPFNEIAVRQAFIWAIPYDDIMEQIYAGRAVPKVGNINPSTQNYSIEGLPTYSYDPEKAKQLLADAGYPDGIKFTISVATSYPDLVDTCVLVKSFAADAGFDITINQMSAADFGTARGAATEQAIIYRNRAQVQTPAYSCTIFFKPNDDPSNPARWQDELNDEFWEYVDKALTYQDSLSPEAGELWAKAQGVMISAAAEIFVCAIQPSQIYRKEVEGFPYRSENAIDFGSITIDA